MHSGICMGVSKATKLILLLEAWQLQLLERAQQNDGIITRISIEGQSNYTGIRPLYIGNSHTNDIAIPKGKDPDSRSLKL